MLKVSDLNSFNISGLHSGVKKLVIEGDTRRVDYSSDL